MNTFTTATITSIITAAIVSIAIPDNEVENKGRLVIGKVTGEVVQAPKSRKERKTESKFSILDTNKVIRVSAKEKKCLVMNAFHEAGVEGHMGMVAVLQVTHARVKSGRWGDTFCSVIHHKAQFSWTLEKKKVKSSPSGPLWDAAVEAVNSYVNGQRIMGLGDALYYHTDYISNPDWAADDRFKLGAIGRHIFYSRDIKKHEQQTTKSRT